MRREQEDPLIKLTIKNIKVLYHGSRMNMFAPVTMVDDLRAKCDENLIKIALNRIDQRNLDPHYTGRYYPGTPGSVICENDKWVPSVSAPIVINYTGKYLGRVGRNNYYGKTYEVARGVLVATSNIYIEDGRIDERRYGVPHLIQVCEHFLGMIQHDVCANPNVHLREVFYLTRPTANFDKYLPTLLYLSILRSEPISIIARLFRYFCWWDLDTLMKLVDSCDERHVEYFVNIIIENRVLNDPDNTFIDIITGYIVCINDINNAHRLLKNHTTRNYMLKAIYADETRKMLNLYILQYGEDSIV